MVSRKKSSVGASSSRRDKGKKPHAEDISDLDLSLIRLPSLLPLYHKKKTFNIQPGRFIKFADFASLNLQQILGTLGPATDSTNNIASYPDLICQFYTNFLYDEETPTITTMVCGK